MIRLGLNGTPQAGKAYLGRALPAAAEIFDVGTSGRCLQRCGREATIDQYGSNLDSTIEGILEMSNGGIAKAIWNRDGQCKNLLVQLDPRNGVNSQYLLGMDSGLAAGDFDLVPSVIMNIKTYDDTEIRHHRDLVNTPVCICFGPVSSKCPTHGKESK